MHIAGLTGPVFDKHKLLESALHAAKKTDSIHSIYTGSSPEI